MASTSSKSVKIALFASVCLITLRVAIALDLVSAQDVYDLTKYSILIIVFANILYWTRSSYLFFKKLSKLPGPDCRIIFTVSAAILGRFFRGLPIQVIGSEVFSSFPLLSFESYNGDLIVPASWMLPVVFIQSYEAMKQIFHHPHVSAKGPQYFYIKYIIGDGLINASGDKWSFHRKLLTPAFHMKILESLALVASSQAESLVFKLKQESNSEADHTVKNVIPHVFDCMINVLCQTSMGLEAVDRSNIDFMKSWLTSVTAMMAKCMVNPFLILDCMIGITSSGRKCKQFRRALSEFVDLVVTQRMAILKNRAKSNSDEGQETSSKRVREPLIDIMIKEHLKNPKTFTLKDIGDEIRTFAIAGVDTSVWSVGYTLLLLGHHEDAQKKLYEEILEFFGDSDLDGLTPEKLNKLQYLDAVLSESLRLYPPGPIIGRVAEQDITVAGKVIPSGAQILLNIRSLHRDARYWTDPHRFKPERFLTAGVEPKAYFPFAAGPRSCIAQKYGRIQIKINIMRIVKEFQIRSITQLDEVLTFSGPLLHTETPIKLQLTPRNSNNNNA